MACGRREQREGGRGGSEDRGPRPGPGQLPAALSPRQGREAHPPTFFPARLSGSEGAERLLLVQGASPEGSGACGSHSPEQLEAFAEVAGRAGGRVAPEAGSHSVKWEQL